MGVGPVFWALFAAWNIAGFAAAARDKRAAKTGGRRTPERIFYIFACTAGGWGVLLAIYLLRHKTRKAALLTHLWYISIASTLAIYGAAEWIAGRVAAFPG